MIGKENNPMDEKTRKVVQAHTEELRTVRDILKAQEESLKNLISAVNIVNASLVRVEQRLSNLACISGDPPCDEITSPETPSTRRRFKIAE